MVGWSLSGRMIRLYAGVRGGEIEAFMAAAEFAHCLEMWCLRVEREIALMRSDESTLFLRGSRKHHHVHRECFVQWPVA